MQSSRLRIHSCSKNPKKLMNYLSPLRSILQRAVSEESKPQQGRRARKQLPNSPSDQQVPQLACCPSPAPSLSLSPCGRGAHHTQTISELLPRSCLFIIDGKALLQGKQVTLFLGRLLPLALECSHFPQHSTTPGDLIPTSVLPRGLCLLPAPSETLKILDLSPTVSFLL